MPEFKKLNDEVVARSSAEWRSAIHPVFTPVRTAWRKLRTSPNVARLLFSIDVKQRSHDDLWDTTSIALREALRRYVRPGDKVLELGTGHVAVLTIYCAKKLGAQVVGVDINRKFLENAAAVARDSGSPPIEFLYSNWFSGVADRKFDVIFGNIPYIPSAVGEKIGAKPELRQIWDGGEDGYDQFRTILRETPLHLTQRGRFLLGVNTMFLPRPHTLSLIRSMPGLAFETIVRPPLWPCEVYVMSLSKPAA